MRTIMAMMKREVCYSGFCMYDEHHPYACAQPYYMSICSCIQRIPAPGFAELEARALGQKVWNRLRVAGYLLHRYPAWSIFYIIQYWIVLCFVLLYHTVDCCTTSHHVILDFVVLYYVVFYYIRLYSIEP